MLRNRRKSKDIEIIERIGDNSWQVQIYTADKRLKRKSHFQIKYDFMTKTKVNTNTENKTSNQLFSQQKYSKDSFDRFGDDLSELILNFLSLKQKFCYECVCKQWQRLVFNKQSKLTLTNLSSIKYDIDTIGALVDFFPKVTVIPKRLELVLKKCPKISEIYINFNKRFIPPVLKSSINGKVFDVITNNCNSLKKFTICSNVENLTKDQIKSFVEKFGKSLTHLRFKYISDTLIKEFMFSPNYPNLKKLDFNSIKRQSKEDLVKNLEKNNFIPKLSHLKYTSISFDGIQVITGPEFSWLRTLDIVLDSELCPELSGSGVDRALRQISLLKCLEVFNVKIFTEDTKITPIDEGLQRMAKNCLNLKRLDFIMDEIVLINKLFDVFSQFRALEFCEISIEYNEDLENYGSIEQFRHCLSLRVFNLYLFNISDEHLVDIDVYIPKMTNFHLRSRTGITDSTLHFLKKCKNLEVFEVHTYDDDNTLLNITDSCLYQLIKCCPKLRIVLLCSALKTTAFDKTIEQMVEKARLQPKVRHVLGFYGVVKLCKGFGERHKKFEELTLVLSPNLRLVNLPHWTSIHSLDYYCNHETADQ